MRESLKIIKQCLITLPIGPIKIENYKITPPSKKFVKILYGKFNSIILNYYTQGIETSKG